jgi:putative glutamine amidotransferase
MARRESPTVGITCVKIRAENRYGSPRFGQNQTYIQALLRAGAVPMLLPQLNDRNLLRAMYERVDGLLLPGGEDIDPAHYGEPLHERCGPLTPSRDEMELALARWAVDEGKPLLAICRGIQVLNVALGGGLYQDIEAQAPSALSHAWYPDYPRDRLSHQVTVTHQSGLAGIVGARSLPVNSLHHQAIKDLAPGLTVTACAPDQIVEAVEVDGHPFALGVQWHPEELAPSDAGAQGLFDALVSACGSQAR